jgi:glycosyltransferase involved in cell wall biosynthesis
MPIRPKITVLLCTARGDHGYLEKPEWTTLGKVVEDLNAQTFKDFELIVVDGLNRPAPVKNEFPVRVVPPRSTPWTDNKKVAIAACRNTGLIHARGELVVNLDDCCELPPNYLEAFWMGWHQHGVCLAMCWPHLGDPRRPGPITQEGLVFGFGSYPLKGALALNGYNEAFDGGQGLEDIEWGTRLYRAGARMGLIALPGFDIHPQTGHDPRAVSQDRPIVKCCNQAWHASQVDRRIEVANRRELWDRPWLEMLVGPCHLLNSDGTCGHHPVLTPCAFPHLAEKLDPEAAMVFEQPPVLDLLEERRKAGVE